MESYKFEEVIEMPLMLKYLLYYSIQYDIELKHGKSDKINLDEASFEEIEEFKGALF